MKLKVIVICVLLLFIAINLSGCDELEPEDKFIYVTVTAKATMEFSIGPESWADLEDMEIEMRILKSGAVKKTDSFITNEDGYTIGNIYHTVKVYKEQFVRVTANLKSPLPQYMIDEGFSAQTYDYKELSWNEIRGAKSWGETYYWNPEINLFAYKT